MQVSWETERAATNSSSLLTQLLTSWPRCLEAEPHLDFSVTEASNSFLQAKPLTFWALSLFHFFSGPPYHPNQYVHLKLSMPPKYALGLPWWLKQLSICLQCRRPRFNPWVEKIPWRRKWQSIPILLPGKSHGQRSLVGYIPWGCKESDMTERLHVHVW